MMEYLGVRYDSAMTHLPRMTKHMKLNNFNYEPI